jgi:hypothetical protein
MTRRQVMTMTVKWNMEPTFTEVIVEVRIDKDGNVYLSNKEDFEFTLSSELVDKIKQVHLK